MKHFLKYAAVGIAGYLVGFYELKYKMMKTMLENKLNKEQETEEESQ